tara:strand:+ start:3714 stop:4472 length:759 start_codon:yes stop_codon:yes gene_type:complete
MGKKPIVAGNWKMNKTPRDGLSFIADTQNLLLDIKNVSVIFSPPFTGLFEINVTPPFYTAAQNCHWETSGAYTGEISLSMIKECGAKYVIVGHSERRQLFGESDEWVNKKMQSIINIGLKPILCIGETIEDREAGKTNQILTNQLEKGLNNIELSEECIIAYEPVWAIGTGLTADNQQIKLAHNLIRDILNIKSESADDYHILYGGSVNLDNANALIQIPGVDGFLIGGASLDLNSFASIVQIVETYQEEII